eukprot:6209040-Amphidinium_carterae.1
MRVWDWHSAVATIDAGLPGDPKSNAATCLSLQDAEHAEIELSTVVSIAAFSQAPEVWEEKACGKMSHIPTGFKTESGEWTDEAKTRFFGAKNEEAMKAWSEKQRTQYKDEASEEGKKLKEKYATEDDLEKSIKDMYQKKWDALLGKAAKCPR